MKPYLPYRDAVAFALRRTAFIASGDGPGWFLEDEGGHYAIGEALDGGAVRGIAYSIYALLDGGPGFHITDEATPRAIRAYAARIALGKSTAIDAEPDDVVLCADTTVALGRRILGKPEDASEAEVFLRKLSGRRHRVFTAVAVRCGARIWTKDVQSDVRMKRLTPQEIASYIASDDWRGKAGGYAIQGPAGALIPWISGSFTGIVGLPLTETANLLCAAGYPLYRAAS